MGVCKISLKQVAHCYFIIVLYAIVIIIAVGICMPLAKG